MPVVWGCTSSWPTTASTPWGHGANATAIAYVELELADGSTLYGAGIDKNIVTASLKAVLSGVNRAMKKG